MGFLMVAGGIFMYGFARDIGGLDFIALTPHCADDDGSTQNPNMSAPGYATMRAAADAVSAESGGAFLALAGMEWSTNSAGNKPACNAKKRVNVACP